MQLHYEGLEKKHGQIKHTLETSCRQPVVDDDAEALHTNLTAILQETSQPPTRTSITVEMHCIPPILPWLS